MELYTKYETEISFRYLKEVVNILDEPICILENKIKTFFYFPMFLHK